MALSSDGTQLFVGLNGAGAVRQVNLTTGTTSIQFSLGGGPGVYNPPYTAQALAVLPGQPNSVAVYGNNGVVTIFDSGVARAKTSTGLRVYSTKIQAAFPLEVLLRLSISTRDRPAPIFTLSPSTIPAWRARRLWVTGAATRSSTTMVGFISLPGLSWTPAQEIRLVSSPPEQPSAVPTRRSLRQDLLSQIRRLDVRGYSPLRS